MMKLSNTEVYSVNEGTTGRPEMELSADKTHIIVRRDCNCSILQAMIDGELFEHDVNDNPHCGRQTTRFYLPEYVRDGSFVSVLLGAKHNGNDLAWTLEGMLELELEAVG